MAARIAQKVVLIGWDGADWQVINPLMESGQMPNLRKLVDGGVMGNLASMNPMISPMLWTSMATGKPPHEHGVCGFVEPDPHSESGRRLAGSTSRTCKAFWNILTQQDIKTHVVSWYAGHPSEPINGVCVSERFSKAYQTIDRGWPVPTNSVHPADLENELAELRVHPQQIGLEHLESMIPRAKEIDQSKDTHLMTLAKNIGQCATNQAITTWIMETQPWEMVATYFNTIDLVSHSFMYYHPPKQDHIPQPLFDLYHDVVSGVYRFHDMMLGRVMEIVDDDTAIVIASDHGYKNGVNRPIATPADPAGAIIWHRPYGMLAMNGPGIKKDELIFGGTILDLTPTVLTLLGVPVGADMMGRPLKQVLEQPREIETVPSWDEIDGDCGMHDPSFISDPLVEMEAMKQLESLGYIEPADENKQAMLDSTASELKFNLARSFMSLGRFDEAIENLEAVVRVQPRRLEAALKLADCYQAVGRNEDCRALIEKIGSGEYEDRTLESQAARIVPQLDYLNGLMEMNEGRYEAAIAHFKQAEATLWEKQAPVQFYKNLGKAYIQMEEWDEASKALTQALESDPDDASALHALAVVAIQDGRNEDAVDLCLRSLQILFQQPRAHFHLGIASLKLGDLERAEQAFKTCLAMRPEAEDVKAQLARVQQALYQ